MTNPTIPNCPRCGGPCGLELLNADTAETRPYCIGGCAPAKKAGRPAKYASAAERQAAYRARQAKTSVSVLLDPDVALALDAYMKRHTMDGDAMTKSEVLNKLIRTQLLRKR